MAMGRTIRALVLAGIGLLACSPMVRADDPPAPAKDFPTFVGEVKAEAAAAGLSAETLAVLDGVQPIDRVIELDRRQPEFTLSFSEYLGHVMTPQRIAKGRKLMVENRTMLRSIERRYGVQARFVVALWGIESGFGASMGTTPVIASLATLGWDGRRSGYFRGELINALKILDHGDIRPDQMVGSWAGAMGQCQFMPSTYLKYAQDWNGDGRRDIWRDRGDALASAANYLSGIGWKEGEGWGRKVRLPPKFDRRLIGLETRKTLAEWSKLGLREANGKPLPHGGQETSLVMATSSKAPDATGPVFLVTDNFRAIMKWNHSTFFALAAGHLADQIGRR